MVFFYLFVGLFLTTIKPNRYEAFSQEYNFAVGIVYIFLLIVFFAQQRFKEQNWLRADVIFIVGYTIVHFQIPFLASLGVEPSRPNFIWINKDVVNYATWMSAVAMAFWMFGYTISSRGSTLIRPAKVVGVSNFLILDLVIFALFTLFLLRSGSVLLSGAYNVEAWGGGATHLKRILQTLLFLRIVYFLGQCNPNESFKDIIRKMLISKIFMGVVVTYATLFLFVGSRGDVLAVMLSAAVAYSVFVRPIKFRVVLAALLVGSFAFTIMGLGRTSNVSHESDRNIFQRGYHALKETEKLGNLTEELAGSIRIQYRAIDTVPRDHDYLYGAPHFLGIAGVFPFFGGVIVSAFDVPYKYLSSASFFTYLGQGDNPAWGEGSEILGDLYVNYGLVGVFLVMLLFGSVVGKLERLVKEKKIFYVLVYVVVAVGALTVSRGSIVSYFKSLAYILFFHFLFYGVSKKGLFKRGF